MSLYGSFDRGAHLSELGTPLEVKGNLLSAETRRTTALQNLMGSDEALPARFQLRKAVRLLTNAELEALSGTPITIIPAPGVGKMILVTRVYLRAYYNGDAEDDATADGDLVLRYAGSSVLPSQAYDGAGFIDQTNDEIFISTEGWIDNATTFANPTDVDNAAVEIFNDGTDYTNGTTTLGVTVFYRVLDTIPV